jgi:hypothetical protein
MKTKRHFSNDLLTSLQESKGLRIRAGTGRHRFIGIWFVVVKDRVFVRSWSVKPDGWYRTFLKKPRGTIQIANSEIAVYAVRIKDKSLRDAVDRAYLERYNTRGALKYAKDLGAKSRATTLELVPLLSTH